MVQPASRAPQAKRAPKDLKVQPALRARRAFRDPRAQPVLREKLGRKAPKALPVMTENQDPQARRVNKVPEAQKDPKGPLEPMANVVQRARKALKDQLVPRASEAQQAPKESVDQPARPAPKERQALEVFAAQQDLKGILVRQDKMAQTVSQAPRGLMAVMESRVPAETLGRRAREVLRESAALQAHKDPRVNEVQLAVSRDQKVPPAPKAKLARLDHRVNVGRQVHKGLKVSVGQRALEVEILDQQVPRVLRVSKGRLVPKAPPVLKVRRVNAVPQAPQGKQARSSMTSWRLGTSSMVRSPPTIWPTAPLVLSRRPSSVRYGTDSGAERSMGASSATWTFQSRSKTSISPAVTNAVATVRRSPASTRTARLSVNPT